MAKKNLKTYTAREQNMIIWRINVASFVLKLQTFHWSNVTCLSLNRQRLKSKPSQKNGHASRLNASGSTVSVKVELGPCLIVWFQKIVVCSPSSPCPEIAEIGK